VTNLVGAPSAQQLEDAREVVKRYLRPTPSVVLSIRGRDVYAKLDNLQVTGAFKVRGALAALDAVRREDPSLGVITSSAGNHGLGISHASSLLGVRATVVVPANASLVKVSKISKYDVELIQFGSSYDEAQAHARELSQQRGLHFVSPFNNPHVVAGQATSFDEFLDVFPDVEHVVVSVGGGGWISGALVSRAANNREDITVTGVQAENSAAMVHYLRGEDPDVVVHRPTIADGLAGGVDPGSITNDIIQSSGINVVTIPERSIRAAVREAVEMNGLVMEGSSAASYAAITEQFTNEHSKIGTLISGRNIAVDLLHEILNES
jgi:threonine dehydratase